MFINIVFSKVIDGWDFFISCPLYFPYTHASLRLSSSVSLSCFILAVPIRECLGKHSCTRSICYRNTEWYFTFLSLVQEKINMPNVHYYMALLLATTLRFPGIFNHPFSHIFIFGNMFPESHYSLLR